MEYLQYQFNRRLPVVNETDILVVGAGPGGMSAAIMAARNGAKVTVAEQYGCAGGMAVMGEISPFVPNHCNGKPLDKPLFVDLCRKMHEITEPEDTFDENIAMRPIDKHAAMLAWEELMLENGVNLLYHHTLFDVMMDDGKVTAALFLTKSGICALRAKIFIDATGDGDLAALGGAAFEIGNEEGCCQPMTTCFKISNIDRSTMPPLSELNRLYEDAKKAGMINCLRENILFFETGDKSILHFNTTRVVKKSGISGKEFSEAEIEGRRQIREFFSFFKNCVPGFEKAALHSIAHQVGVRESRRIRGLVFQTADDFRRAAKYPDGVVKIRYPIDIHNPSGNGTHMERMKNDDWYELRYGALVPQNTKNILMGCRAVSVDHALHSSSRVMAPVCSIGQAAGLAATMCIAKNCQPSELNGKEVRKKLQENGAGL